MVVQVTNPDTNETIEYYLEPRLKRFLDKKVKESLSSRDKDYVMLIDGYEGAGKSTFGQQVGKYIDPTLNLSRICMDAEEFRRAIYDAKKDQCVIYDEAVTGMSAGDSIAKVGKLLKSLLMQMRQKNLFVIIIIPSVFELNKYSVLSRARSFFRVYESGGRRGYFAGYNRKDLKNLYLKGKKYYTYKVRTYFRGRFYGKYVVDNEAYRLKKEKALEEIDKQEEKGVNKLQMQRDVAIWLASTKGASHRGISDMFLELGVRLSHQQIGEIIGKIADMRLNKAGRQDISIINNVV